MTEILIQLALAVNVVLGFLLIVRLALKTRKEGP